jgi:hypothetical protein
MKTTILPPDPDAERVHDLLQQAYEAGATALDHVGKRLMLLADAGDVINRRCLNYKDRQDWLALHFAPEEISRTTVNGCLGLARAREANNLNLESRRGLIKAMAQAELLPGFDGVQGVSKKPISHLTLIYRLHHVLAGMFQQELLPEARQRIRDDMQCLIEIYARLGEG